MKIPARAQSLLDRAAMTGAASVIAYAAISPTTNALTLDWATAGGIFLGGALFSALTNIARGGISGRLNKED